MFCVYQEPLRSAVLMGTKTRSLSRIIRVKESCLASSVSHMKVLIHILRKCEVFERTFLFSQYENYFDVSLALEIFKNLSVSEIHLNDYSKQGLKVKH